MTNLDVIAKISALEDYETVRVGEYEFPPLQAIHYLSSDDIARDGWVTMQSGATLWAWRK